MQLVITVRCALHKYSLNFTMDHLTVADYPTKSYIVFSSGDTIGIEMKKIGRKNSL